MSTYTIHPRESHHRTSEWTLHHPLITTAAVLVAAVVAGVLVGVLFSAVVGDAPAATQHRAGGHATATVTAAQHAASAADPVVAVSVRSFTRSPARGGFAVGRAGGAGDGFIDTGAGAQAPARGGFPGRSLAAGQAPAVG